ncbi:MAG TPA: flagellar biosynthesis anti-sigma factor FlgM [Tepidisphaeraceae bacterium]|nr:flagellar biosynthesis anti-sigma factor FlgM [Tepidisphaeraceae bacterium]
MSSINNVSNVSGISPLQQITSTPIQRSVAPQEAEATSGGDRLELSGVSQVFQSLQANNIRTDKVSDVKSQIEAGTYEDDTKLNSAIDKLLDDVVN